MARLVVLGAGESGVGAAVLALKKGFEVFVSDKGQIKEKYQNVLSQFEIAWEEGQHTESLILNADEVVKSPGIPDTVPLVVQLQSKGIPVISEIEFAARYTNAKFVAITGSNGKTTTTLLAYDMFTRAGYNVGLAGNVGHSLAMQVATTDREWYVLEVSSFQLDGMFDFKADIAILLNITPDHLDRYDYDINNYVASKFRIIQNLGPDDHFIYCIDDELTMNALPNYDLNMHTHPISIKQPTENGAQLNGTNLEIHIKPEHLEMSIHKLALQGKHNIYNSMAAAVAARLAEIRKDSVRESLADYQNIEHRLEHVAKVYGIDFINDSKATNVNSTWWALESMQTPVIWIAGGVDKGNAYGMLDPLVREKVKAIVCIGTNNAPIIDFFQDKLETIVEATSMVEAVGFAYQLGTKGDTVLLSPACASFDRFENYEDRGAQFKLAVKAL